MKLTKIIATLVIGAALAVVWLLGFSPTSAAQADAITSVGIDITTTVDEFGENLTACSLREAIYTLNTGTNFGGCINPIIHQINLPAGTYILTIAGSGEENTAQGDLDIKVSMTIVGAGPNVTIIDGGKLDRVFDIHGATGEVTLEGIRIRNGVVTGNGGGIAADTADLTLLNTIVFSNTASANGGGIYALTTFLAMTNTRVAANDAVNFGGGIMLGADDANLLRMGVNCVVAQNTADHGGGIFIAGGQMYQEAGLITENTADENGGGIAVMGGDAHLLGGVVLDNSAFSGGGVWVNNGSALLSGTMLIDNSALEGGGLFTLGNQSVVTQTAASSIISNTALGGGGIMHLAGLFTLQGGEIISNTAGSAGGGIAVFGGNVSLSEGSIRNNSADRGGGVYISGGGTITATHMQITDNTATSSYGGGIFAQAYDVKSASSTTPNALSPYLTIIGGEIAGNEASYGGGISVRQGMVALLEDVLVHDNLASNNGGGINVSNPDAELHAIGCQITGNDAYLGGGLFVNNSLAFITNTLIASNTAVEDGGGVYMAQAMLGLTNLTLDGNQAFSEGGGLYLYGDTKSPTETALGMHFSTITDNASDSGGDGIHLVGSITTLVLQNNILAGNGTANCNTALASGGYNIDSGTTCGFTAAGDQSDTDPLLDALADNGGNTLTHALLPGSPAIDTGLCISDVDTDQRGEPRPNPVSAACDIGAYESSLLGAADLSILQTVSPASALPGENLIYTIAFSNTGPAWGMGVVISEAFPSELTLLSVTSTVNLTDVTDAQGLAWEVEGLEPGQAGFITLTAQVGDENVPAGALIITATINGATTDTQPENNIAAASVEILNAAPLAQDQAYTVDLNTTLVVQASDGLLSTASDPNGDTLSAILDTGPLTGTLTLNADGSFTYVPVEGFTGVITFTYYISDGALDSNLATVSITVEQSLVQVYLPTVVRKP